jgi:cytochrome b involved in lipid metabolism
MSRKDQQHKHNWQKRLKDWFIMPHSTTKRIGTITVEELAKHSDAHDCWIAVEGVVYDVTRFLPHHPGGPKTILMVAGRDATDEFMRHHKSVTPPEVLSAYIIGTLEDPSHPTPLPLIVTDSSGVVPPRAPRRVLSDEERQSFEAVFDEILGGLNGPVPKAKVAEFLHGIDDTLSDDDVKAILAKVEGAVVTKEEFVTLV